MASSETKKSPNLWLWGCAIGCGTLLLAGAAFTLGGYLFVVRGMDQAKTDALKSFAANYAIYQQSGRLERDQETVFAELLQLTSREDTSFMAAVIADYLLKESISAKDDAEKQLCLMTATELRDLLRDNPRAGLSEMADFVTHHPKLKAHFYPEEKAAVSKEPPLPWQKHQENKPDK